MPPGSTSIHLDEGRHAA